MWQTALSIRWADVPLIVASAAAIYVVVILLTRIAGQRSLAAFSTFDFAVTVAVGAMIARVTLVRTSLLAGVIGLSALFLLQRLVGMLRRHGGLGSVIDNRPILLVWKGQVLEENLRRAHIGRESIYEQLRLAGMANIADAQAVVMERSGEISVVAGDEPLGPHLLEGVVGVPRDAR